MGPIEGDAMRNYSFWACLTALALTAGTRADDAYTIKFKHAPDVGKTITVTDNDTKTASNKVTDGDGKVVDDGTKHTEKLDEVYAETVLEKGDKFPKKYKRTYEKATRTLDGKSVARSYEGRTVIFEEKGGKYTVTAEGDKPLSKEDLEELTNKANDNDADKDEVFLPAKPVKVGDSWKIDGKKLVGAFAKDGNLDGEKSGGEAKLTKVYKQDGHQFGTIVMTLKMAAGKAPAGVTFDKPPVVEMKITLDAAIDGSTAAGEMTMTGGMGSKATLEQMGKKFTIDSTVELSGKKKQSAEK
jgi:hypothetical protein